MKILGNVTIPLLLTLYGLIWISLQPVMIYVLSRVFGSSLIGQISGFVTYGLINVVFLYSWFKLAKAIRDSKILD
ncbi:MAG: hypothetical protein B7O98_05060 [Zestosphaera tikiterensis]|uniref:Uncharacterized protein n=1 Tax=Zestosphaera tikiterensis TaxID=1973259 RepID=A0A2R7Y607_9CREN|nr:MAG: hypothetical protein B7O98_05060 [Zestosphaera tikiterensis]